MKRNVGSLLAAAVLGAGINLSVAAHEGHEHKVMGTVTSAAADQLVLEDKDGQNVTVKVTKDTKVRARPAVSADAIKAGTRVVITATEGKDKRLTATVIEVGPAPPQQTEPQARLK